MFLPIMSNIYANLLYEITQQIKQYDKYTGYLDIVFTIVARMGSL